MLQVITFVSIVALIVFAAHLPLYYSMIKFFNFENKKLLFYIIVGLSLSYIISSVISHKFDNFLTRIFYYTSSIWMGVLVSFLIFIFIALIFISLSSIFGLSLNLKIIGYIVIVLSIAWSLYGIANARKPIIKEIEVNIKNLPEYWDGKKAVQISDVHLGVIHGEKYMDYIVEQTNKIDPEIIFITGDLFDGTGDHIVKSASPLGNLRPNSGAYYISGNHETYLGIDKSLGAIKGTGITHLNDKVVEKEGLQIIGIDYKLRGEQKNLKEIIDKAQPEKPKILLIHEPVKVDYFKDNGIDLMLAGHTHNGQLFPFNYITKKIFKGFDYGLHQIDDFNIYTTNGAGTWGPPMRSFKPSEIVSITLRKK